MALSPALEQQVRDLLPDADVQRLGGGDRTETALLINGLPGQLGVGRPMLAGTTSCGDIGLDGALIVGGTDVEAALHGLAARVAALESALSAPTTGLRRWSRR